MFWETTGARVARRNLVFSILSEHVGFCIWSMWSAFVLFLGPEYGFDAGQKFLLTTVPTLVGALARIPYTFAVARFGGRNWTIISSALLLIPSTLAAVVLEPGSRSGRCSPSPPSPVSAAGTSRRRCPTSTRSTRNG